MSERIRISYSIGIEQLTAEITRLFDGAKYNLGDISKSCELPSDVLSIELIKQIDSIRQGMYNVDQRLSDVSDLVNSYLHHVTRPVETSQSLEDKEGTVNQLKDLESFLNQVREAEGAENEISD